MAEFNPAWGSDTDLGETTPVPAAPVVEPLAVTRPAGEGFPEAQQARRDRLLAQQERVAAWPPPEQAVRVRKAAEAQGVPLESAFDAPETVGTPQSLEQSWADHADAEPYSTFLESPDVAYTTEEGRRQQLKLLGWANSAIPGGLVWGGLKGGYESVSANQLEAKRLLSEDGLLSPEDEAEAARLEARAKLFPRPVGFGEEMLSAVAQQGYRLGSMLGIGAAVGSAVGTATGGVGALPAAATAVYAYNFWDSTGAVAKEFRESGIPHKVTRILAPVVGAAIAGLDTASAGALTKIPGLNILRSRITKLADLKPALALAMKDSRFLSLIGSMAWEGGTEGAQEALQILGVYGGAALTDTPVKTPNRQQIAERVAANALLGSVVGGFINLPAEVGKHVIVKYSRGTESEGAVNRLYDITDKAELTERAPDAQHRYVEAISKKTGVESVTVPAEALTNLYQKAAEATPASPPAMPDTLKAALAEAQATGGRVEMSLADFVTHVRPLDTGMTLKQEVGLNADLSAVETKALKPAVEKALKIMQEMQDRKDFEEDTPEAHVLRAIEKQLVAVGYTPEGANTQATLLASGIDVLAKRAGKNTSDVYNDAKIVIERGSPTEAKFRLHKEQVLSQTTPTPDEVIAAYKAAFSERMTQAIEKLGKNEAEDIQNRIALAVEQHKLTEELARIEAEMKAAPLPERVIGKALDWLREVKLFHDRGGVERGTIRFDPVLRNVFHITLTGNADLSTFLHESSHYLLELMRKLAPESPEITQDLRVLEEWAGVKRTSRRPGGIEVFHGTPKGGFAEVNHANAKGERANHAVVFGKGDYFAISPEHASAYAYEEEGGAPAVFKVWLHPKKVFNWEQNGDSFSVSVGSFLGSNGDPRGALPGGISDAVRQRAGLTWEMIADARENNETRYHEMEQAVGQAVSDELRAQGYDAVLIVDQGVPTGPSSESQYLVLDPKIIEYMDSGSPEWSTEALEKFARGFETYLGEGKAPSSKLAQAFATFKSFILHVYKMLTSLNAPLTDEVRSVMDRMLATQDEINTQSAELGYFPADATGDGLDAAREAWAKARRIAQEKMDRKAITALRKETTAEFKRYKAEAAAQIDKHPVMVARNMLTASGHKLDLPDLLDRKLTKYQMTKLAPFTAPGPGMSADEVAWEVGFSNGSELIKALTTTPERATLINIAAKERMADAHPDYGQRKDWITKEALETLHEEDAVSTALELDLSAAYSKAGLVPPQSAARVAKTAAQKAILGTTVSEIKIKNYLRTEEAMHKAALEAYAAKDYKAAADALLKRIYARALWQEGNQALKEVEQVGKALDRYNDTKVQGAIGRSSNQVLEGSGKLAGHQIRDALLKIAEATGRVEKSSVSEYTLDYYLRDLEQSGFPIIVASWLRERPIKYFEDLTVDEVMAIKDAIKNLQHIAKEANGLRVESNKLELANIATEVEGNLRESKLLERAGDKGETAEGLGKVSKYRGEITKPETLILDLDGGKPGIFHRLWMQSAEKGQFEAERRFRMRRDDLKKLGEKYMPKDWRRQMKAKHLFVDGKQYTGEQVYAMLLNMGTEANRTKLVEGMLKAGRTGWSVDSVTAFIHQVFPDQAPYKFAQATLNYISNANLWEDSSDVMERIVGVRPKKEEAIPFVTPDGSQMEGGYYPLVYDHRAPQGKSEITVADALAAMQSSNPVKQYADRGHTMERTGYVAPLLLDTRALAAHLYSVDHFIANAESIIARHRLISDPTIKGLIVRSVGYDAWASLRASNNYIAADGHLLSAEMLQTTGAISKLLFGNAIVTMGGNFNSALNQIVTGIPATLTKMGPSGWLEFGKSLTNFARNPYKMWNEMSELSGELKSMEFHYDRDLRMSVMQHMTDTGGIDAVRRAVAATSMYPVMMGQKVVNVITFNAAYNVEMKRSGDHAAAVAYGNMMVRQSQSSAGPKDMTAVQRSPDMGLRILTALASYTFTLNDMVMPRRLKTDEVISHTARLMMLIVSSAVLKELFDLIFPVMGEKDDKRAGRVEQAVEHEAGWAAAALFRSASDQVANVPVMGRMVASVMTGRQPRMSTIPDTLSTAFKELGGDDNLTKKEAKAIADALGIILGVPTRGAIYAPGEFVYEYLNGNIEEDPYTILQELFLVRPGQKGEK